MEYDTINDAQTIAGNGEGTLLAGRYRIVRQLGQGGMGSVWLAEDTQLDDKPFAIKMLPSILVSNKRAYRQLKDEALVAMKLTHPNIVTLRAFEENNGNPFLVMDYVDGQTMDDYLEEKGRLPEAEVVRILKPVAAALDYAHGEGVVHRDVKPANVMIRKDGHPFILDFGIAREIQKETMTRVTDKLSSGTLRYMSPEQLMGESPKPAQDVYSFAAMAYECLKGEPPFVRGAIKDQIKTKPPEPLAGVSTTGSLPGGANGQAVRSASIAASVMAGLAKKPEDRPKSCAGVLEGSVFSRKEHKERKEVGGPRLSRPDGATDAPRPPVGSRVPRDRSEGPRSGAAVKGLLAAALIAALSGGAWWWAAGTAGTTKTTKTTKITKITGTTGGTPIATEADVSEIAVEATVQKARVERIDDADGFKARKDSLADGLTRATAYGKAKRWAEAALGFTNYVNECKALLALDADRQTAKKSKADAEGAKDRAFGAGAAQYAAARWNAANTFLGEANILFGYMSFADATSKYADAAKQFNFCVGESKAERQRWEEEVFANVTNELARAIGERGSLSAGLEDSIKPIRNSPRGFKAFLQKVDDLTSEKRIELSKVQTVAEATNLLESVRIDIKKLEYLKNEWQTLRNKVAERDLAVGKEKDLDEYLQGIRRKYPVLEEPLGRNAEWNEAMSLFDDARKSIDYGDFLGALKFFVCISNSCERIINAEAPRGAITAFRNNDWVQGVELVALLDSVADADLQYYIGFCLDNGYGGLAENAVEAVKWYERAAKQRHRKALVNLGKIYKEGRGVPSRDIKAAMRYFEEADRLGDVEATFLLGSIYADAKGGHGNDVLAVRYLRKAREAGITDATNAFYSLCCRLKEDREQTLKECRDLHEQFKRSRADQGMSRHCANLLERLNHEADTLRELPPYVEGGTSTLILTQHGLKDHVEMIAELLKLKGRIADEMLGTQMETRTISLPNGVEMEMIRCKAGEYVFGDNLMRKRLDHGFWLGKYAVTQRQWESVMVENPASFRHPQNPVENVSWDMCQEFIWKVNELLHCGARLPTEEEWEYACRAGTQTEYSWGVGLNGDKANCNGTIQHGNGMLPGTYEGKTVEVNSYKSNAWGFFCMHGNVWEWCSDLCDDDKRVLRGGSWYSSAYECRSASRRPFGQKEATNQTGFRLCLDEVKEYKGTGPLGGGEAKGTDPSDCAGGYEGD